MCVIYIAPAPDIQSLSFKTPISPQCLFLVAVTLIYRKTRVSIQTLSIMELDSARYQFQIVRITDKAL